MIIISKKWVYFVLCAVNIILHKLAFGDLYLWIKPHWIPMSDIPILLRQENVV